MSNIPEPTKWDKLTPRHVNLPFSWVGHIPFAMWLVRKCRPATYVELGTHTGNSYMAVCEAVVLNELQTRCFAVDTWEGDEHAGEYGHTVLQKLRQQHDEPYGHFSTLLQTTFDNALAQFADGSVDLLHIDGLHTYEAVRHDFESWQAKLAPHAVVWFHDIAVHDHGFGVHQYWQELQLAYPHCISFQHSNGLGVLFSTPPTDPELISLLDQTVGAVRNTELRERFQTWGNQLIFHSAINDLDAVLAPFPFQKQALLQRFDTLAHEHNLLNHSARTHKHNLDLAHTQVLELTQQIQTAQARLETQQHQLQHLNQALEKSHADIQRLEVDHHTLVRVLASRSWRATEPVRSFGRQVRSIKTIQMALSARRKLINLSTFVHKRGVMNSIDRTMEVLKQEGTAGLKNRINRKLTPPVAHQVQHNTQTRYDLWMRNCEHRCTPEETAAKLANLQSKPVFSVVMPVYNPPLELLKQAVASVLTQSYPHWELCIADDASPNRQVAQYLTQLAANNPHIKVTFRATNGHISEASNSALALAEGDYVALLDHDDLLAPDALLWMADAINQHPDAQILYSDEDKVDLNGQRSDPHFKSNWNLEIFLSQNMVSHLGVYRRALLEKINGFRLGYEGAQDHDLALRCLLHIEPNQIVHIPKVLYHWRVVPGSTAANVTEKPYAQLAGERALNDFLMTSGLGGRAEGLPHGRYRIHAPLPEQPPLVTIVIPTRNCKDLVQTCIESIRNKTTYPNYDILLIDNGSDDPAALAYFDALQFDGTAHVMRDDRPFNYSALNNAAVKQARGELICLLNNDIEIITPGWLDEMVSLCSRGGVGAVGAKLWYPDDYLQHGGVIIGLGGVAGHAHHRVSQQDPGYFWRATITQGFSAVTAACLLVSKANFWQVGGLNEQDLTIAFNDVDFCLKLREAGLRNVWTPFAQAYHHESVSRGAEDTPEKIKRFAAETAYMQRRWPLAIAADPYYNPNLDLHFAYQFQPRTA